MYMYLQVLGSSEVKSFIMQLLSSLHVINDVAQWEDVTIWLCEEVKRSRVQILEIASIALRLNDFDRQIARRIKGDDVKKFDVLTHCYEQEYLTQLRWR